MVDTADLKSARRKAVSVRIRPGPFIICNYWVRGFYGVGGGLKLIRELPDDLFLLLVDRQDRLKFKAGRGARFGLAAHGTQPTQAHAPV